MSRATLLLIFSSILFITGAASAGTQDFANIDRAVAGLQSANPGARIFRTDGEPVPRTILGLTEKAASADPETAARAFLGKYSAVYTLDTPGVSIETRRTMRTGFGRVVQFGVRYKGLEIVGGSISVTMDLKGRIRSVASSLRALAPMDTRPGINRGDAFERALSVEDDANIRFNRMLWRGNAPLVVVPLTRGPALAYQVTVNRLPDMSVWRVYVNAATGRVIFRRPLSINMNQAKVYDPSPGYSMTDPAKTVTLTDFKDPTHASDKTLTSERVMVKNCAGDNSPRTVYDYDNTTYVGPICDWVFKLQADSNGDFLADPLDPAECPGITGSNVDSVPELRACFEKNSGDTFVEAMTYYHVNKIYDIFRSYGFDKLKADPFLAAVNTKFPDFYDMQSHCEDNDAGGQTCSTTLFMPFDNAAYTPYDSSSAYALIFNIDQDAIILGQGTHVDYGYDATVTYHEMTHAVVDALTGNMMIVGDEWGLLDEPGAINEGTADYYATTTINSPKLGGYARRDSQSTSMLQPDDCLRDMAEQVVCPEGMWGEVHNDGGVFANALWNIRDLYMTTFSTTDTFKLDKAIFDTMSSWGPYPYFTDVSEYIIQSLADTPDIGADFAAAARLKFEANNVTECKRYQVLVPGESKMLLFHEAGTSLEPTPGYMQFAVDVPSDATKLMMSFKNNPQSSRAPKMKVMFRKDTHVQFTWDEDVAVYDYWVDKGSDGFYTLQIPELEPGNTYYLALTNNAGTNLLSNIKVEISNVPVVQDGGVDGGGEPDGQAEVDGSVEDGGEQDGQALEDGGTPDGSSTIDGSLLPDGSSPGDGATDDAGEIDGGTPDKSGGCSCSAVGM